MYPFIADTFTDDTVQMCDHIAIFATMLEDTFVFGETNHLNGFDSDTIADVCWASAWKHVMDAEGFTLTMSDFPNLCEWMHFQGIIEIENERNEEDDVEDEEEEEDEIFDDVDCDWKKDE
tara:strand:- start:29701 stop:30060 length:360 start_codon:yes stop_codon:yes gene_type:complete